MLGFIAYAELAASDPPALSAPASSPPAAGSTAGLAPEAPAPPTPADSAATSSAAPRHFTLAAGAGLGAGKGGIAGGAIAESDVWPLSWLGLGVEGERAGNRVGNFYAVRGRLSFRQALKRAKFMTASVAVGPARVETSDVKQYSCGDDSDIACGGFVSDSETLVTNTRHQNIVGVAFELGFHLQARWVEGAALVRLAVDGPVVTVLLDGAVGFGF